jgi:hypothetical protein
MAHVLLPASGACGIGGAGAAGLGLLLGPALAVAELEAELCKAIRSTGATAGNRRGWRTRERTRTTNG